MSSKPPDEATLYEAALTHLSRYAATESGLARVLARRIDRWARLQAAEAGDGEGEGETISAAAGNAKSSIPRIITRLQTANLLNDGAFATARAKRLTAQGKSRRGALAHLAAKGVAPGTAAEALADDPERELAAACAFLRRRRAGPFGSMPELKILGAMARAGFTQSIARQALGLDKEEAEAKIKALKD
jgi:regulatory protein